MKYVPTKVATGLALTIGLSGGATLLAGAAQAAPLHKAATTTTTLAPPVQGTGKHQVYLYVDTVTGSESNPAPAAACAMTNLFQAGQQVVFRMDGVNVANGGVALTNANTKKAYVKIPGVAPIPMAYGTHGTASYWTAAWKVPAHYPFGIVNFSVHVITDPVPATKGHNAVSKFSAVFTQKGLAPPSQLTIVAAAPVSGSTTTTKA